MKPSEDELISHIKKTLAAHEEPYLPGAWEKFNESTVKTKKRIFGFYQFLNVAAMLLVCAFVFLYVDQVVEKPAVEVAKNKNTKPVVPEIQAPLNPSGSTPAESNSSGTDLPEATPQSAYAVRSAKTRAADRPVQAERISAKPLNDMVNAVTVLMDEGTSIAKMKPDLAMQSRIAETTLNQDDPAMEPKVQAMTKPVEKPSTFNDFLEKEQLAQNVKKNQQAAAGKIDKWEMGLMVAPSLSNNNKLNLGYGLSMGYAFSNKVSLVSGISYNDMTASNQIPAPVNTASIVSGNSKSLESVEASVSGIDIPLGIKYNLSKKVYANVGISAFAVLNERKNNTYMEENLVQSASTDPASFGLMKIVVLNERVTERVPEASAIDNFIGFYHFSIGFRQPLSKKNTLSLEPFLKLPMKETSQDNLKLIGTGIKLKLDF